MFGLRWLGEDKARKDGRNSVPEPLLCCLSTTRFRHCMSEIPTISITDPNHESTNLSIGSPSSPPPPGSPTVFDVVKDMEALDRDDLIEEETIEVPAPEQSTPETNEAALDETSTIEPEETAQNIPEQQLENPETFYHDKTVLLTGATGFVGKALLWKLLMIGVKKVFILVRPIQQRGRTTVQERLQEEILANKASALLNFPKRVN